MKVRTHLFLASLFLVIPLSQAHAAPGDMWTQLAEKTGAFSPHTDNCDSSTEEFITVGGGDLGYCIEKSERSADRWYNAKQTCASVGKRLPEPMEFQYACANNPGGLSNMTGNFEWASNSVIPYKDTSVYGAIAVIVGRNSCDEASVGAIGLDNNTYNTQAYRCVR